MCGAKYKKGGITIEEGKEEYDDLMEQLFHDLMDRCWVKVNQANERLIELEKTQRQLSDQLVEELQRKAPELTRLFEDFLSAFMEKEAEEDRAIYEQGAKDLVALLKQVGIF